LSAEGADVILFSTAAPGAPTTLEDGTAYTVKLFRPLPRTDQWPTPLFIRELRRELRRTDVAHLSSVWNPFIESAALTCRIVGTPYIISPRGMLQRGAMENRRILKRVALRFVVRGNIVAARALHFLTDAEASTSLPFSGIVPAIIVPNGVDAGTIGRGDRERFLKRFPALNGRTIVLFVGRLHPFKRIDLQLEALALLKHELPDAVLVLVGPDGGEWARLARIADRLGIRDRVLWTGMMAGEERFDALASASAFVLTSHHEAHSMAMNESLALGVPLVLTDTVGFSSVEKAGAGRIVASTPGAVAAAIKEILVDPERARAMGTAGRALARGALSWPSVAKRMIQAYQSAVGAA
jgi:glycosyltransferase involved in cell wall biosynthesis